MKATKMKIITSAIALLATAPVGATECYRGACEHHDAVAEVVKQQMGRQIARQLNDSITDHLAASINPQLAATRLASLDSNRMAASSDGGLGVNSVWNNFSWTRIEEDNMLTGIEVDMYQDSGGIDLRFGDFIVGVALTYVNTGSIEGNPGSIINNRTNTVELTPYAAYIINQNMFVSATSGYGYYNLDPRSATVPVGDGGEMDAYNSEIAFNGVHMIDKLSLRGKAGFRYQHWHTKNANNIGSFVNTGLRDNMDNWGFLADAEIGYNVLDNLRAYTGAYYEYNDRVQPVQGNLITGPNSQRPSGFGYGQSVFYFNAGLDYYLDKSLSVGAKFQTDLSDNPIDLHTVGLNLRYAM